MPSRYALSQPLALALLSLLLAPLALAQERAAPAALDAAARWAAPLAPFQAPSPAPLRAPVVVTAYEVDLYEENAWLDFESGVRTFDAQGRLTELNATTLDFFSGGAVQIRVTYAYAGNGQIGAVTQFEDPTNMGTFTPTSRTLYAYDGDRLTSRTLETYQNDAFVPSQRTLYAYDGDRVQQVTEEGYDGSAFVPERRETYTYAGQRFPVVTVFEDYVGGTWQNDTRDTIAEDGADLVLLTEIWDGAAWVNEARDIYANTSLGDFGSFALPIAEELALGGNTLFGSLALLYASLDPTSFFGLYSVITSQEWRDGAWANVERSTVARDADLVTEVLNEIWDGAAWANDSRTVFSYTDADRVDSWDEESWDGTMWTLDSRLSYAYGADGYPEQLLVEEPDFLSGELGPAVRFLYTWTDLAVATEDNAPAAPFTLALDGPNPFATHTALRLTLAEPTHAEVRLYDVLGREVRTLADAPLGAGPHRLALDAGTLPPGLYVVRVRADGRTATRALTLAR